MFSFDASATDDDQPAQTLTYALIGPPEGATINAGSGLIAWTPTEAQGPMVTNLIVSVTDSGTPNLTVSHSFQITVNEVNLPPSVTLPGTQTLDEQTLLSVSAPATDPDIPTNTLTFSLVSPPPGASIDPNTGAILWTPSEAQGPDAHTLFVRVTDSNPAAVNAQQLNTTNSFAVNVNEVNLPPTLLPVADQFLNAGMVLNLANPVSDSDLPPNSFQFALLAGPSGADLDANTGVLNWRPLIAQADTTNLVTVQVTDNGIPNLSSNRSYLVIVNPLGEVTLAPVGFTNGQFLIRIEGFAGPDYTLEATSGFTSWTELGTTNPAVFPFEIADPSAGTNGALFYRTRLGP